MTIVSEPLAASDLETRSAVDSLIGTAVQQAEISRELSPGCRLIQVPELLEQILILLDHLQFANLACRSIHEILASCLFRAKWLARKAKFFFDSSHPFAGAIQLGMPPCTTILDQHVAELLLEHSLFNKKKQLARYEMQQMAKVFHRPSSQRENLCRALLQHAKHRYGNDTVLLGVDDHSLFVQGVRDGDWPAVEELIQRFGYKPAFHVVDALVNLLPFTDLQWTVVKEAGKLLGGTFVNYILVGALRRGHHDFIWHKWRRNMADFEPCFDLSCVDSYGSSGGDLLESAVQYGSVELVVLFLNMATDNGRSLWPFNRELSRAIEYCLDAWYNGDNWFPYDSYTRNTSGISIASRMVSTLLDKKELLPLLKHEASLLAKAMKNEAFIAALQLVQAGFSVSEKSLIWGPYSLLGDFVSEALQCYEADLLIALLHRGAQMNQEIWKKFWDMDRSPLTGSSNEDDSSEDDVETEVAVFNALWETELKRPVVFETTLRFDSVADHVFPTVELLERQLHWREELNVNPSWDFEILPPNNDRLQRAATHPLGREYFSKLASGEPLAQCGALRAWRYVCREVLDVPAMALLQDLGVRLTSETFLGCLDSIDRTKVAPITSILPDKILRTLNEPLLCTDPANWDNGVLDPELWYATTIVQGFKFDLWSALPETKDEPNFAPPIRKMDPSIGTLERTCFLILICYYELSFQKLDHQHQMLELDRLGGSIGFLSGPEIDKTPRWPRFMKPMLGAVLIYLRRQQANEKGRLLEPCFAMSTEAREAYEEMRVDQA